MKRLKVLMSAYACEPHRGSEPGIGWNYAREMAAYHDICVITRANNRHVIEQELKKKPIPGLEFVYYDLPAWVGWWKRGKRGLHLYYYLWQLGIYPKALKLHNKINFDIVHHVTFGNYWMASYLVYLPCKFIWGPVGGGESSPRAFYTTFSFRGRIYEAARSMIRWIGERDPTARLAAKRAMLVLATTPETEARLKKLGAYQTKIFSNVILSHEDFEMFSRPSKRDIECFRLISVGNLLHWKGFHLGLLAFSKFYKNFKNSEYWIIGDGPERYNLEQIARKTGIEERIKFMGKTTRAVVIESLIKCDVLIHPSLHDSGGWVCSEAMAAGKPVICLNLGGPAMQVTYETGFVVPANSPKQAIGDIAKSMDKLAADSDLWLGMSKAGQERVSTEFSWQIRSRYIDKMYRHALNSEESRRVFGKETMDV